MKLLCITDLHGNRTALDRILEATEGVHVILLGGDITNFGTANEAEGFVRRAQQSCSNVFAVAGNCDSAIIDARLADLGVSLFGRGVMRDHIGFQGVSAMPTWQGNMYELSEEKIAAALEAGRLPLADAERDVVLSHTPPHGMDLDQTKKRGHVGSQAVREFVQAASPSLVVCGHIHEARGIESLGATTVVNCGPAFLGHFAVACIDQAVDVELRHVDVGK